MIRKWSFKRKNLNVFDFDDKTGVITNGRELNVQGQPTYGVEFSKSSDKLYISTGSNNQGGPPGDAYIFQFSLSSDLISDINSTRQNIAFTNSGYRGALQLASNGKIYYSRGGTTYLGVINSPEETGRDVNYNPQGVTLSSVAREGLPPFIQSFFLLLEVEHTQDLPNKLI